MDPRIVGAGALISVGVIAGAVWLAFGRASGERKRFAWRLALLAVAGALVALGERRSIFERSSSGFAAALAGIVVLVVVGQLYSVRFCGGCGRMVRNFRRSACPRCGGTLPRHGFTRALRRPATDPVDPLRRKAGRSARS